MRNAIRRNHFHVYTFVGLVRSVLLALHFLTLWNKSDVRFTLAL